MPTLRLLLFCGFIIQVASGWAMASDSVRVNEISIQGNKVTKDFIILRELDFQVGTYLNTQEINGRLQQNRNQIFNTRLFNVVQVSSMPVDSNGILVIIELTEKWYIWPYPVIKFADRNFNIWWETKDFGS